jgi:hypothetical protein
MAAPPAPRAAEEAASSAAAGDAGSSRFLQGFIVDAEVTEGWWFEGQGRVQNFAGNADAFRLGPIVAFTLFDKLEVGGRIDYISIDTSSGSESGASDTTAWAKWQFNRNPVQVTVGGEFNIPTGDDGDGTGTGEFDAGVFVAVRKNLAEAYINGYLGLRENSGATIAGSSLNGKSSTFLGGGVIFPATKTLSYSGELTVETERYENTDAMVELTGGVLWDFHERWTLRGGVGFGLDDGSPDWELIFGLAWHR